MVDVPLCCIFFVLGTLVLCTYAYLVFKYQGYDQTKQNELWAVYLYYPYRIAWGISAVFSAGFFVAVSVQLIFYADSASDGWTILPYTLFLFFSMLYVPLLLSCENRKWIVILDLVLVALSSIGLCARMAVLWGFDGDWKIANFVFLLWIAFHCTVLDGVFWGYSWYFSKEVKAPSFSHSEFRPASHWPRIRSMDLSQTMV